MTENDEFNGQRYIAASEASREAQAERNGFIAEIIKGVYLFAMFLWLGGAYLRDRASDPYFPNILIGGTLVVIFAWIFNTVEQIVKLSRKIKKLKQEEQYQYKVHWKAVMEARKRDETLSEGNTILRVDKER